MIEYNDWNISASGFRVHTPQYLESLFCQSNGYIGSRAIFFQDGALPHERCTYMAGGFDYISDGITDMVNLPDPFHFMLKIEGSRPRLDSGHYTRFRQQLDLSDGLYTRESVWKDSRGNETFIKLSRFISMSDRHGAALCIELTALNHDGGAELLLGLDSRILNLPVHDDQMLTSERTIKMLRVLDQNSAPGECSLNVESRTGRLNIGLRCRITQSAGTQEDGSAEGCPARKLYIPLRREQAARVEKLISINDPDGLCARDFDSLLADSRKVWALRWADADIEVEADDPNLQAALRYNLFQLMQSKPFDDPSVSIGARGLTHARYKGCYFWDTDIFIQPFFLYTDPAAARELVRFRLGTLPDARENASKLDLEGARYPWMCAIGGKEQCHTWDIGRSEIHITADVVFAADQYLRMSGDESLRKEVSELFIETARYWASRFTYDGREDVYNLLFVKGPDEYCGISSNNAFTVFMARYNLELALKAAEHGFDITPDETEKWRDILKKSRVEYDASRELYIQDDTFLRLEPLDLGARDDDIPLYRRLDYDRLQRYRVLKQADLILLMLLLPDRFTESQKQAIWNCYEPITLHDSSLSFGIHAWAAAVLGKQSKTYFQKSLYLDLENIMGNTGTEGIHMAALGATWQAAVFGFAGLSAGSDGKPLLTPRMPDGWASMRFKFYMGGIRYKAEVTQEGGFIKEDRG